MLALPSWLANAENERILRYQFMCGIAGFLHLDAAPADAKLLRPMTDVIAHRGPDGEGQWAEGPIGFGHRRLAILDLSKAGRQPMSTPDDRYTITYNGEVYNFREIRRELEQLGHEFRSQTDTEVILHAFAEWREKAIVRMNGMFALAIWDKKRRELFLARDRYGIKPLYWSRKGNLFAFGSEIKAILAHPDFHAGIDKEGLVEYFTFQNYFSDRTLFKGVSLFPAGHWGVLRMTGEKELSPVQYWDFHFEEPSNPAPVEEYEEELDRLFQQAVRRQLVSDVEVGAYLSGGMDSGSITAIAAREIPNIKSFTCGFDLHGVSQLEYGFDERDRAEYMSYLFQTEHYEIVLKSGDMERCLPELARHLEEPRVGQSYPNWYASKLASKFVKVVLAGTGGDELFAGYPWRYYRAAVNENFEDYIDKYYLFWQRLIPNKEIQKVFSPIWEEVKQVWTRDIFRDVYRDHTQRFMQPEDYINSSLYFEAKTFLNGLLVVEDKLSMAHGLESRVPFLDNDLVDFAQRVPVGLKLSNLGDVTRVDENAPRKDLQNFQKTNDGKQILRKVMARHVPEKITSAVKQGFSAPDASWFKDKSSGFVDAKLLNEDAAIYQWLDRGAVKDMVGEHLNGKRNRRLLIWSLLNLEELGTSVFQ
jgi:asparagine synthase (glutamine-hydrolysing)